MIAELHAAGLKVWSIYEKGYPTSDAYFAAAKGTSDGNRRRPLFRKIHGTT